MCVLYTSVAPCIKFRRSKLTVGKLAAGSVDSKMHFPSLRYRIAWLRVLLLSGSSCLLLSSLAPSCLLCSPLVPSSYLIWSPLACSHLLTSTCLLLLSLFSFCPLGPGAFWEPPGALLAGPGSSYAASATSGALGVVCPWRLWSRSWHDTRKQQKNKAPKDQFVLTKTSGEFKR